MAKATSRYAIQLAIFIAFGVYFASIIFNISLYCISGGESPIFGGVANGRSGGVVPGFLFGYDIGVISVSFVHSGRVLLTFAEPSMLLRDV
jgi:hypothetical protein